MNGRSRTKHQTFGQSKGATRAWGGDLCELLTVQEVDKVPHLRRRATDDGACQMYHACRVLSRMRDTVILIHGPRGCAQTLNLYTKWYDGFKMQGRATEHPMRVECSNLTENDVVFGGADRLREAILDADRRYHPTFIPIMETCVPGMIGDDMDAVVAGVQREVQARLIVFHVPGFRAVNPADGTEIVYRTLVREVMEPPKQLQKDQVNIWGYVSDPRFSRGNHDCDELLRLLRELGLTGKFFLGGASIEDVQRAAEAGLNIPYQPSQVQGLLRGMEERFGSNCITQERPLSVEMTKRWLKAVGHKLGLQTQVEGLIEREAARLRPQLAQYRKRLEGKTVAIHAVHDYTVPLLWLVGVELGMIPTYVGIARYDSYLYEGLREIQEYLGVSSLKIVINASKFEEEVIVSKLIKPDVYIADFDYMPKMFTYMQPTVLRGGYEHTGPHLGFNGAVNFARELVWAIENPFARKVVPYAGLRPYSSQAWLENSPLLEGVTLENIIG